MSITSHKEKTRSEAYAQYRNIMCQAVAEEHEAMNQMLNVLRTMNRPMTPEEIKSFCTSSISVKEIYYNLKAMANGCSRYSNSAWRYGERVPEVNVPTTNKYFGTHERIVFQKGECRKATVIELDSNGKVIPGTQKKIWVQDPSYFSIEKIK